MKIIKNGNDKVFQISCHKCKSDFEYKLSDVKEVNEQRCDFYGSKYNDVVERIFCPVCNEKLNPNYREVSVNEQDSCN